MAKMSKPDPDSDGMTVGYDVPLTTYQMVDEYMLDDTATEFDVYAQLMQLSADAEDDTMQQVLFESAEIAKLRINSANDD